MQHSQRGRAKHFFGPQLCKEELWWLILCHFDFLSENMSKTEIDNISWRAGGLEDQTLLSTQVSVLQCHFTYTTQCLC